MRPQCGSMLLTILLGSVLGCGGEMVKLRGAPSLDNQRINEILWHDACRLQSYFDARPPRVELVTSSGRMVSLGRNRTTEVGEMTFRVPEGGARRQFLSLLGRFYRAVPAVARRADMVVTVEYYQFCGRPRLQRGGRIVLRAGGARTELAYHPCVGAFLLNRDIYRLRRSIVAGTALQGSKRGPVALLR